MAVYLQMAADALAEKNVKGNSGSSTPLNQTNQSDLSKFSLSLFFFSVKH